MHEPAPAGKPQGQPKTQRFEVSAGSPWIGMTLGEVNLRRRTGVHIVGLQKRDAAVTNPEADIMLEQGDLLILFGLEHQLEQAAAYLSQRAA